MSKVMTLIGVTGLVGTQVYRSLKNIPDIGSIRLIVRRPLVADDPRTEVKLVDFNDAESLMLAIEGSDVLFCAVGTTNKKVKGDKDAYRKVDFDIPVHAARFAKMTGCETFVLVSAVGANSHSRNFYLKLKGEAEDAVKEAGLRSVHIMRPSFLLGNREEKRGGEQIAQRILQPLSFLFPSKYKPIHAETVAAAMIAAVKKPEEGVHIYEYRQMMQLLATPK